MECPECGAQNPEGASYCNLCLKKFGDAAGTKEEARPKAEEPQAAEAPPTIADIVEAEAPEASSQVKAGPPTGEGPKPAEPAKVEPPVAKAPQQEGFPRAEGTEAQAETAKADAAGPQVDKLEEGALPPGAFVQTRKKKRLGIWIPVGIALLLLIVVGLWYFTSAGSSGKSYKSHVGLLTFKYPPGWKQISPAKVYELTNLDFPALEGVGEVTLADSNKTTPAPDYIVTLTSSGNSFTTTWDKVKASYKVQFAAALNSARAGAGSSAVTFSQPRFKDIKVGGDPALSMTADVTTSDGRSATLREVLVIHEETVYRFTFWTRKPQGSDNTSTELLNSVKYELAKPNTNPQQQ
jgi:hypothetical protein